MKSRARTFGVMMLAGMLIAGCGDSSDVVVNVDNDNRNPNRTATPIFTPTSGPTPLRTATIIPTEIEPTETPGPGETTAGATATPGGSATGTATPQPGTTPTTAGQGTATPSPAPTTAGPSCGNGVKETGEQCDTGTVFNTSPDCGTDQQCACCLCRPSLEHAAAGMTLKCSTCHPAVGPLPAFPAGATTTFPGLCEGGQ